MQKEAYARTWQKQMRKLEPAAYPLTAHKRKPAHYLCIDGHGREVPEQEHGDVTVITAAYSGRGVGGGKKRGRELTKGCLTATVVWRTALRRVCSPHTRS